MGWLFTDDLIGDDKDRWRSASLALSWVVAREWNGTLPSQFGDLIEIRAYTEAISPEDLVNPGATDRQYAGILGLGFYTHFAQSGVEYGVGAEIVAVGPQTGVDSLQTSFHKLIGSTPPSSEELSEQIPNGFYPTATAEIGRQFQISPAISVRPFGEARVGDETLVRVGVDFTFGHVGSSELLVRDKVTGQRYRTMRSGPKGLSFLLGVDTAYVHDSVYLPESHGIYLENQRIRGRFGLSWEGKKGSFFYGATYLSREFKTQREAQIIGSVNFKMSF